MFVFVCAACGWLRALTRRVFDVIGGTFDYAFWFAMVNKSFSKALSMVILFGETAIPSMPFDVATSGFG